MLRVFKLGRIESLKTQPVSVHSSLNVDKKIVLELQYEFYPGKVPFSKLTSYFLELG